MIGSLHKKNINWDLNLNVLGPPSLDLSRPSLDLSRSRSLS